MLDVETNALKSKEEDLLSASICKSDDGGEYVRFLPLDFNREVYATEINGIIQAVLEGEQHLTLDEVDRIFDEFEFDRRTVLRHGALDPPGSSATTLTGTGSRGSSDRGSSGSRPSG